MSNPNNDKIYKIRYVSNGHGGYKYHIAIPSDWLQLVWWNEDDTLDLTYDENKCIVRKTGFTEKTGITRKVYFAKRDAKILSNCWCYMILPKEVVRTMDIHPCDRVQWTYIERGMMLRKINRGVYNEKN